MSVGREWNALLLSLLLLLSLIPPLDGRRGGGTGGLSMGRGSSGARSGGGLFSRGNSGGGFFGGGKSKPAVAPAPHYGGGGGSRVPGHGSGTNFGHGAAAAGGAAAGYGVGHGMRQHGGHHSGGGGGIFGGGGNSWGRGGGGYTQNRGGMFSSSGIGSHSRSNTFKNMIVGAAAGYLTYQAGKAIIRSAMGPMYWNSRPYYWGANYYRPSYGQSQMCRMPISNEDTQFGNVYFQDQSRPREIVWGCGAYERCCGYECCRVGGEGGYGRGVGIGYAAIILLLRYFV